MKQAWLREDVMLFPLVDQWYAWAHLIAPVTAALNIAKRHLPILDSYASAPALHARAVRDERNLGGPFVDYPNDRSADIRTLAAATRNRCRSLLALGAAIEQLRDMLRATPPGSSLEPLYSQVPDELKGCVELVREVDGRPGFRLIEELLYRGPHYLPGLQAIAIRREQPSPRPFSLSTPFLDEPDMRRVEIPFTDTRLDQLVQARLHPVDAGALLASLGLPEGDAASLFTDRPPQRKLADSDGLRVLGHATVLIEHAGTAVIIDPVVGYESARDGGGWTYADLPDVLDAVVITHAHQDHLFLESLLQLRGRISRVVVPPSARGEIADPSPAILLRRLGFPDVIEAPLLEPMAIGSITLTALPFLGEHGDLPIGAKAAYAMTAAGRTFLFMADFRNLEHRLVAQLAQLLPPVDTLFIGMECEGAPVSWLYGPLLATPLSREADASRRLSGSDCAQAMGLVEAFLPKRAFVYAMGQERWLRHITSKIYTDTSLPITESLRFVQACRQKGLEADVLHGPCSLPFT
ncbi:MAG: MBL fold metallo-hydrolase [Proteobacteria bacterium]|nr:MBL fold metallo-hydrolase [Pseudomonadota bacterium]